MLSQVVRDVGQDYTGIGVSDLIVDNIFIQAFAKPLQVDVVVTPTLHGRDLSSISDALIDGSGLVPGVNFGREYAVFELGCCHLGLDINGKNSELT